MPLTLIEHSLSCSIAPVTSFSTRLCLTSYKIFASPALNYQATGGSYGPNWGSEGWEGGRGEGDLSEKSRDWALASGDQLVIKPEGTNWKLSLNIDRELVGGGVGKCELNFKNLLLLSNYSVTGQGPSPGITNSWLISSHLSVPPPRPRRGTLATCLLLLLLPGPHPVCHYFFSIS